MISVWWIVVAFVVGGCAGFLLMALMRTVADEDASAHEAAKGNEGSCSTRNG